MTMRHHPSLARAGGFTLIEVVTSLVIISIVLVATGSAVLLASRAMPNRTSPAMRIVDSASAMECLNADLTYATSVSERTAHSITFRVPDRTGDGVDETIRYAWDSQARGPLTRSINGAAAAVVLEEVAEFTLVYDLLKEQLPTTYTESAETLFFQQDASANLTDFTTDANNWIGQAIRPSVPSGTAWWKITRVSARARARGAAVGETRVQLRNADALGLPGSTIHDQAVLLESALTHTYQLVQFRYTRGVTFAPGTTVCIVFRWVSDSQSCDLQYRNLWTPGGAVTTSSGGLLWSAALAQSMIIQVYGTTATADPPRYRYTLNNVRVTLRTGSAASGHVSGTILTLNRPEVPPP